MSVCSDPCSLSVDDRGVLRARIAGDPATSEWPYLCTLQNSNLHRDTDCMWVDPLPKNLITSVQGDQSPGVTMALNVPIIITDLANLVLTNPDPCRSAGALVMAWMEWTFDGDFDPSVDFGPVTLSRQITGPVTPAEGAQVETYHDHTGTRTTMVVTVRTVVMVSPIAPSASANIGINLQATRNDGSMIWQRARARLTGILTAG